MSPDNAATKKREARELIAAKKAQLQALFVIPELAAAQAAVPVSEERDDGEQPPK